MTFDAAAAALASSIPRAGAGVDSSGMAAPPISRRSRQRTQAMPTMTCRSSATDEGSRAGDSHLLARRRSFTDAESRKLTLATRSPVANSTLSQSASPTTGSSSSSGSTAARINAATDMPCAAARATAAHATPVNGDPVRHVAARRRLCSAQAVQHPVACKAGWHEPEGVPSDPRAVASGPFRQWPRWHWARYRERPLRRCM